MRGGASLDGWLIVILAAAAVITVFVVTAGPAIIRYAGSGFLIQVQVSLTMVVAGGGGWVRGHGRVMTSRWGNSMPTVCEYSLTFPV